MRDKAVHVLIYLLVSFDPEDVKGVSFEDSSTVSIDTRNIT